MNSVKVVIESPEGKRKTISKDVSNGIGGLISSIYLAKSETNAYLSELIENEKGMHSYKCC